MSKSDVIPLCHFLASKVPGKPWWLSNSSHGLAGQEIPQASLLASLFLPPLLLRSIHPPKSPGAWALHRGPLQGWGLLWGEGGARSPVSSRLPTLPSFLSAELSTGPPDATLAMNFTNESLGSPSSSFILSGLPGLEAAHFWLAFPLCAMYVVALVGNSIVVLVIIAEPALHTPMYFFLGMLAGVDLALASCTMPRVLSLFWLDAKEIAYRTCLLQMFFIHSLSGMESTILLAMAVDRYVAICRPLQYSTILTNSVTVKVGVVTLVRGLVFFLPLPLLLNRLSFCKSRALSHSYCLHQDMMNLACDKHNMNIVYGLIAISLVMGLDFLLILVSYLLILKAVLGLSSWEQRLRASGTCLAHLCMVLAFYVPLISLSVIHRYRKDVSPLLQAITSNIYLLVPPVLNPIVYGARTRDIRKRALKFVRLSRNREPH